MTIKNKIVLFFIGAAFLAGCKTTEVAAPAKQATAPVKAVPVKKEKKESRAAVAPTKKKPVEVNVKKPVATPVPVKKVEKKPVERKKPTPPPVRRQETVKPVQQAAVNKGGETINPVIAGLPQATDKDGSKIHAIIMPLRSITGASQFSPIVIRIKAGESIAWINEDTRTHYINSKPAFSTWGRDVDEEDDEEEEVTAPPASGASGEFNSPVIHKGETWVFRPSKKGVINYYCFTHPMEMVGKIIVE